MTNNLKVVALYNTLAGDTTPTVAEMNEYYYFINNGTSTIEAQGASMMTDSGKDAAFALLSTEQVVNELYLGLLGKAADADLTGKAYWIGQIDDTTNGINLLSLAAAIVNGADATDTAYMETTFGTVAAELAAFGGGSSVEGSTYYLTANQDILTGTDDNDTFIARGNSSLDNADIIDGGAGVDTVKVMLDNDETAESPLLTNVEILEVQAQSTTTDSGDNDVDGGAALESNIDAGDMESVHTYINDNSRADLTIEDVSYDSHKTTIEMRETDMGDVDYNVFFDPENITAPGAADSGATLLVKLANVYNIAEGENPVDNFATLSFMVGDTTVTADISAATSYDTLVTAIQTAIAAAGLTGLEVTKQADSPSYFSIDVEGYQAGQLAGSYNPILITNNGEGDLTPGNITLSNDSVNSNITNTMTNVDGSSVPALTQTDVVFDRVGRDSKGGDFIAGSDSTGANSGSKGIQQFDVEVDRGSWLTSVASTNNTLEVINVKNISENSDGMGSLRVDSVTDVRVIDASSMVGSSNITADLTAAVTTKYLDLTDVQADNAADNSEGNYLNVVDTYFSYDFGSNDDTFALAIAGSNLAEAGTTTREDFVLEINGNDGDDTITTSVTGMTTAGYANSKENANLTIDGGKGNDTITTTGEGDWMIDAGTGNDTVYSDNSGAKANWAVNADTGLVAAVAQQGTITLAGTDDDAAAETLVTTITDAGGTTTFTTQVLANGTFSDAGTNISVAAATATGTPSTTYTVTEAAGVITIVSDTAGVAFTAATVAGADDITAGALATTVANVVAVAASVDVTDLDSNGAGTAGVLYKSELTVTYSGALGVNTEAAAANDEGFESTVTIATESYLGDQASINQAIKNAINNDDTLKKLLVVKDGPANTLVITSLVDGVHASTDIAITVAAATLADLTTSEQTALQTAYKELQNDSDAVLTQAILNTTATNAQTAATPTVDTVGAAAANMGSDNTIDLGNGVDVVVLSTDADSAETLVFTSAIGENTVVNFTLADDILDFTSYLTDMSDTGSGSDVSQVRIATTSTVEGSASIDLTSNEVAIVNDFAQTSATSETWATMSAADVDAALTDASTTGSLDYGNIAAGSTSVNGALVGTTQKSILMIENDLNDGEYKVFEVTETTGTNAYAVTLLGQVDFGDTIDATTVVA